MKVLHSLLAASFALLLAIGCSSKSSEQPDPQQELAEQKQELERQKLELERENATLVAEKEKREAAERAKKEEEERTYPLDIVAGIWNVRMVCLESDCPNRRARDVISETWNISYLNGHYQIAVSNAAPNTNKEYTGAFDGKYLRASFGQETYGDFGTSSGSSKVHLNLRMKDQNTLVGEREVVNSNPCTITYQTVATRSR